MPACTAFGVKSSARRTCWGEFALPPPPPQPASASATRMPTSGMRAGMPPNPMPTLPEPMRRVTFSRNFTGSLSRTCQCYCKDCAFATHQAHLHAPDEVERMLDDAARRGVKELLVLTGEKPEVNAEVARRLAEYGHEDFTSYVAWTCERALERGM